MQASPGAPEPTCSPEVRPPLCGTAPALKPCPSHCSARKRAHLQPQRVRMRATLVWRCSCPQTCPSHYRARKCAAPAAPARVDAAALGLDVVGDGCQQPLGGRACKGMASPRTRRVSSWQLCSSVDSFRTAHEHEAQQCCMNRVQSSSSSSRGGSSSNLRPLTIEHAQGRGVGLGGEELRGDEGRGGHSRKANGCLQLCRPPHSGSLRKSDSKQASPCCQQCNSTTQCNASHLEDGQHAGLPMLPAMQQHHTMQHLPPGRWTACSAPRCRRSSGSPARRLQLTEGARLGWRNTDAVLGA